MKIAVVGVGGVGGYFGGRLARGGTDVIFIARGAMLEALRTRGLQVDSVLGNFTVPEVAATDDPVAVGHVDAILMCVKAWQIEEAARDIRPLVGPDTMVVPLQNGIDAPQQLASILGPEPVLGGLCAIVSFVAAPGVIRHAAGEPMVMFGEIDNRRSERTERLREEFRRADINAQIPPDIHRSMWTKFIFIAPLSGIGALTRMPVGAWRSVPETRAMAERAVEEVASLARARGVAVADDVVADTMGRYDSLAADATASLQRDVMEGKPSELEAQLGAVVRLGRESSVATPVHEVMYSALLPAEREARRGR